MLVHLQARSQLVDHAQENMAVMPEFFESLPPAELWISFRSNSSDEFRASEGRRDGQKNEQLDGFG